MPSNSLAPRRFPPAVALALVGLIGLLHPAVAAPKTPTLSGLRCADGEVARYDGALREWVCSSALTDLENAAGGEEVKVFDANGVEVGPLVGPSLALREVAAGPRAGTFFTVGANRARLVGGQIFYTGLGCSGDAHLTAPQNTNVQAALEGAAVGPDPSNAGHLSAFLLADPDSAPASFNAQSRFGIDTVTLTYGCTDGPITTDGRPGIPVLDLEPFVPPFVVHD
jgi:hypothetical protein